MVLTKQTNVASHTANPNKADDNTAESELLDIIVTVMHDRLMQVVMHALLNGDR